MKQLIIFLLINIALTSCDQQKPKIDYSEDNKDQQQNTSDTKKILISDLPVLFENTDTLIFPIKLGDVKSRKSNKLLISSYSDSDSSSSYSGKDFISGNFVNMTFQDKKGKQIKLSDKNINITNLTFLREIFDKTKRKYLLYSVNDKDTNNDKEINYKDIKSLYISKDDGNDFKKITKSEHEFYDYKIIAAEKKVYFRTLEDINKDGELNNQDKFHYYYLDFSKTDYKIMEHNPLKLY